MNRYVKRHAHAFSADGSSPVYVADVSRNLDLIQNIGFVVGGTWGSGTVTLHVSIDGNMAQFEPAEVSPGTTAEWTADTAARFEMPSGAAFKIVLTGSTSPDLDVNVSGNIRQVAAAESAG